MGRIRDMNIRTNLKKYRFWLIKRIEYVKGESEYVPSTRAKYMGPYTTFDHANKHRGGPTYGDDTLDIVKRNVKWKPKFPQRWTTLDGKPRKRR